MKNANFAGLIDGVRFSFDPGCGLNYNWLMRRVSRIGAHDLKRLLARVNDKVAEVCVQREGVNLMEVCGTHTMAIGRFGLRSALDPRLRLLSGPGCPVCVTTQTEIDRALRLAFLKEVTVLTFGDMMRVPGARGSLAEAKATGADVRVVYSPRDGLEMAIAEPQREFVFLGVGFETTAPTVAATIIEAKARRVENFSVLPMFKLIPPALAVIAASPRTQVDGFILPGHVSTIIGSRPYRFLARRYRLPGCITGFEAADILAGIYILLEQIFLGKPDVAIQYRRSVREEGNPVAQRLLKTVFKKVDAAWRGIGRIKRSGLGLRRGYERFDAGRRFDLPEEQPVAKKSPCRCGEVMLGAILPPDCPLFARRCTPAQPVGPCMVSSEGACAAYYKYER